MYVIISYRCRSLLLQWLLCTPCFLGLSFLVPELWGAHYWSMSSRRAVTPFPRRDPVISGCQIAPNEQKLKFLPEPQFMPICMAHAVRTGVSTAKRKSRTPETNPPQLAHLFEMNRKSAINSETAPRLKVPGSIIWLPCNSAVSKKKGDSQFRCKKLSLIRFRWVQVQGSGYEIDFFWDVSRATVA